MARVIEARVDSFKALYPAEIWVNWVFLRGRDNRDYIVAQNKVFSPPLLLSIEYQCARWYYKRVGLLGRTGKRTSMAYKTILGPFSSRGLFILLTSIVFSASVAFLAYSLAGLIRARRYLLFRVCLTSFALENPSWNAAPELEDRLTDQASPELDRASTGSTAPRRMQASERPQRFAGRHAPLISSASRS